MRAVRFPAILPLSFCALAPFAPSIQGGERIVAGVNQMPPAGSLSPGENVVEFVVEVIREAARREGKDVVWREVKGSLNANSELERGLIDIYPSAIESAERRERFYLSDPWWYEDTSLLVPLGVPHSLQDLAGKRIMLASKLGAEAMRRVFPASVVDVPPEGEESIRRAAAAVCRGEAAAALMPDRWVISALADRPPECLSTRLQVIATPATVGVSLMSLKAHADVARRLRRQIDGLARDGTLARIAQRHPGIPSSSAVALAERAQRETTRRELWLAAWAGLAAALLIALWIAGMYRYQRKLAASEKALRLSNNDLQAYAYTVSHDLQEPLRIVSTYSELLERQLGPSLDIKQRQFMATMREGALRMNSMLHDLLSFSRAGESPDPPGAVDSAGCARAAVAALGAAIQESGADIRIGPLPPVLGWSRPLEQVFQNLIGNAIKYRRPGVAPKVEVSAEHEGRMWLFSVADNGIGMDLRYADRIFRVFQRLHGRGEYSGNGIGLAIAQRIVERHGGRMWVDWQNPAVARGSRSPCRELQSGRRTEAIPVRTRNRSPGCPSEKPRTRNRPQATQARVTRNEAGRAEPLRVRLVSTRIGLRQTLPGKHQGPLGLDVRGARIRALAPPALHQSAACRRVSAS